MKVIVVGAGTAGLVATPALRNQGVEAVALEKADAPGGRISSSSSEGYILDLGAQFFTRYYETTFEVCRDVGLGGQLVDYHFRAAAWRDGRMYPLELSRDPAVTWRSREYQPGGMRVLTAIGRMERDSYSDVRGLYLCGEYMRMPGTVEGAFRSGKAAAEAVLRDLT
jgi:predicted NAD/FAD-dependent oxidoreductase